MQIGTSIFLIALGAILKFAVTTSVAGIDIPTVGVILLIVGVIGLVISLFLLMNNSGGPTAGDGRVVRERETVRDRDPRV